jgi:hypothetical protein
MFLLIRDDYLPWAVLRMKSFSVLVYLRVLLFVCVGIVEFSGSKDGMVTSGGFNHQNNTPLPAREDQLRI